MARWAGPLVLFLAVGASFVAVHPAARSGSRRLVVGLHSAWFGPTAGDLHQEALGRAARAEYGSAEALCREALLRDPDHAPSRALLKEVRFQMDLLNAIRVTCCPTPSLCDAPPRPSLDDLFRELLEKEGQTARR